MSRYDCIVVGGGTAGEYAAGTLLAKGKTVAIVEKSAIGGDCVFHACIPTKSLAHAARYYRGLAKAETFGFPAIDIAPAYSNIKEFKDHVVAPIASNRDGRWRDRGATIVQGEARFVSPRTIQVAGDTLEADLFIICTGSHPFVPPIEGLAEAGFLTNVEALELDHPPDRLAIIGGGPIGIELGQVFSAFGTRVTVYEAQDRILPLEDQEVSTTFRSIYQGRGAEIRTSVKVLRVERTSNGKAITIATASGTTETHEHTDILLATGRRPTVEGLGLELAGIAVSRAGITIDQTQRTNLPQVFAAGDVTGGYMYTYVAGEQGKTAAMNASDNGNRVVDYSVVPRATFCDPEIASVGMSESQATDAGFNLAVGKFGYENLTRSIITGEADGFVKVIVDRDSDKILGCHIIGAEASSLIHEVAIAIKGGVTATDLGSMLHSYPTYSEAVRYACQSAS